MNAPASLASSAAQLELLARWAEQGWLRQLDRAFAAFLAAEVPDAPPLLLLAAALTSHQLGRGHAGLDLAATLKDPAFALSLPPEGMESAAADERPLLPSALLAGDELDAWLAALHPPPLVGSGPGATPLVRIGTRLDLRRYWQYEQEVREAILQRVATRLPLPEAGLRAALAILFPPPAAPAKPGAEWQKLACALAARHAFGVVTGGPGTGKTTTVVKLLALLQALALKDSEGARPLSIRLAAPTGKAAARLKESIAGAVGKLELDGLPHANAVRAAIPLTVSTLHRLLGSRPDSRRFRHDATNPLALDVLVIDEASMVDLEMMAAVFAALPPGARLILLGDKDQLASVEAGAVLGELCRHAADGHYLPETCAWLHEVTGETVDAALIDAEGTPLDQGVAMLRRSHRFNDQSGIGRLAAAVNAGDVAALRAVLRGAYGDLVRCHFSRDGGEDFRALIVEGGAGDARRGYRHYLERLRETRPAPAGGDFDAWAVTVLAAHAGFQVLSALRRGPWGVDGLNQRIALLLTAAGLIDAGEPWYEGRPVLVTRNDYALGLMNGDIGIALMRPLADGKMALRVAFTGSDGAIKWVLPSRLTAVDTVFALTVHKSQGSEFAHTALLLPDTANPILTRELIYTGITRARTWLTLAGSPRVLEEAVERRVLRLSGLLP